MEVHKPDFVALRMDDPGACSKRYEVYSDTQWNLKGIRLSANWLFLKYLPPFRKWGVYRELTAADWERIFTLLQTYHARMTVAVTATWVESKDRLIPYPQKFPEAAAALREGVQAGLVQIANHGLTHCRTENNQFKPRWFESNRSMHREFYPDLGYEAQYSRLERAQGILQHWLKSDVLTLVPPGNLFQETTLEAAAALGFRYVWCATVPRQAHGLTVLGNEHSLAFHDRELVLEGLGWLQAHLEANQQKRFLFAEDLAQQQFVERLS